MNDVALTHSVVRQQARGWRTAVAGFVAVVVFVASLWALSVWIGTPAIPSSSYGDPTLPAFAEP